MSLVRQTLAEMLPTTRRQRLHARIADAIERLHPGDRERQASALAHHLWHAGAAADADKTVDHLMLAAKLASDGAAHEDALVANGPFCTFTQNLFRTSAGIAAAAARHWSRAEEHFRTAIHQADDAPYRVAQPTARYWYPGMLRQRGWPGDRDRARQLQAEALRLYESLGMAWHARQLAARLAAP